MKYLTTSFIILFLSASVLWGQEYEDFYFDNGCNYDADDSGSLVTVFGATDKADAIVAEILQAVPEYRNKEQNFIVRVASVKNARATMRNGQRYILYNINFLAEFEKTSLTRWAATSVFAHEIGHHVLEHDLASTDMAERRDNELGADNFSGRVLARMNATQQETLAGINTFGNSGGSESHPNPLARQNAVGKGFYDERQAMSQSVQRDTSGSEGRTVRRPVHPKFKLPLDQRSFNANRWNLLDDAIAEIDDEKIKVNFQLPPSHKFTYLRICLLATDKSKAPGSRMTNTISGIGSNIRINDGQGQIIWNYQMEGFSQPEVTDNEEPVYRLVVYNENYLPHLPTSGGWIGSIGLTTAGLGGTIYGLAKINKAARIYKVYEEERNKFATVYANEDRDERYDRANGHHITGQIFAWSSAAVLAGGGIWLYDKIRMRSTYKRDFCLLGRNMEWEPLLAQQQGTELGLRLWF